MKQKRRTKGNGSRLRRGNARGGKRLHDRIHDQVHDLMAAGGVEDEVALELGVDKNQLRRKHIRALRQGRAARRQQQAEAEEALTREEQCVADVILNSFADGNWLFRGRCLLWRGTDGDFARTPADAFARWLRDGHGWLTAGLARNFSAEQLSQFVQLKAEALKLLG